MENPKWVSTKRDWGFQRKGQKTQFLRRRRRKATASTNSHLKLFLSLSISLFRRVFFSLQIKGFRDNKSRDCIENDRGKKAKEEEKRGVGFESYDEFALFNVQFRVINWSTTNRSNLHCDNFQIDLKWLQKRTENLRSPYQCHRFESSSTNLPAIKWVDRQQFPPLFYTFFCLFLSLMLRDFFFLLGILDCDFYFIFGRI